MTQYTTKPSKYSAPRHLAALARTHLVNAVDKLLKTFGEDFVPSSAASKPLGADERDLRAAYLRLQNVAEALRLWHSSDEFLDQDGMPKTLARTGPQSLLTLSRCVVRQRRAAIELSSDLINLEFVEPRSGGFAPAGRSAVIGTTNTLALAYATIAISRMTRTMAHNFSGGTPPRYERQVSDVSIRAADLPVFLRFVEQQGQYLIDAVDDWLAKRKLQGGRGQRRVSVGVGTFAWADTISDSAKRSRRAVEGSHSPK
jgi:hypothetical protein